MGRDGPFLLAIFNWNAVRQAEKRLIQLMARKEAIEKSIVELKTRMAELNEHIKKVKTSTANEE